MKEIFEKNKTFIGIIIAAFIIGGSIYMSKKSTEKWKFIGYQYRWSSDYVENPNEFNSQLECEKYGNEWLNKQHNKDALFTCSLNTRPSDTPGIDTADMVCEYNINGLIRCRK